MAALLGADLLKRKSSPKPASEGEVVPAANDNALRPGGDQRHQHAIERAVALRRNMAPAAPVLPVSAPFHCALMQPRRCVMQEALARGEDDLAPAVPLVANVLASAIDDPETIRARLVEQVTGMVRWRESMLYLSDQGVDRLYEVGAGRAHRACPALRRVRGALHRHA